MGNYLEQAQGPATHQLVARRKWQIRHLIFLAAILVFLAWSADGVGLNPHELVTGIPEIAFLFRLMMPPDLEFAGVLWRPALETIYIAVWGVTLATVVGLPLGILAAGNVTPSRTLQVGAKSVLSFFRSISELIWGIFFVTAVGLGPFSGALALGMNYGGILGRLYAEAMEGADPGPVEALQASGASRLQTVLFGIFPQVLPQFVTYNLYWFEVAVRSATVLGMVGAGGIGFEFMVSMRLFRYQEAAMVLVIVLGLVTIIDAASTYIRSKIY